MRRLPSPWVPVSWGELLDKITILQIKRERIRAPEARANVAAELEQLRRVAGRVMQREDVMMLVQQLRRINEALWDVEDSIREEDAQGRFGQEFIRLARAVYHQNDQRAELKRQINESLGSELVEEKSYWSAEATIPSMTATAA